MSDDELRRLAEAATQTEGEWSEFTHLADEHHGQQQADVDFIVAASPDRILALLDRLAALEAREESDPPGAWGEPMQGDGRAT